ncbi:hypothetical protein LTR37_000656 [Vermiconidia calcicola]|uniref:Uncharacterized protein n=1 Tax=Vermiconidia calcicola TaxID=1690605 RepID=A0ACC3NZ72_9PEZI|nr:hypothetical protein LTR37_000656 [Vermiconidia calcicola]
MSEAENKPVMAAETPITEPTITEQPEVRSEDVSKTEPTSTIAPAAESSRPVEPELATETKPEDTPTEPKHEEVAPVAEKKPVEPITEGQLTLKGPGLLKSIIPSKKEFWLSDEAVPSQSLNFYMRGEKPEIAHAVVAWASQTGKGLLFFNKKGESNKKQPGHVLPMYDATDLRKESSSDIAFKLHGQELVLKATSDTERDGWYMSLEKAVEMGKAQKDEVRESEGYKSEMEKLNKPNVAAASNAGAAKRSQSQPKKSMDVNRTDDSQRKNSADLGEEKKARSTSRGGVLGRLKNKKDETEMKREEKKEDQEEKKVEPTPVEESRTEETAAAGTTGAAIGAGWVPASSVDDTKDEEKKNETVALPVETKPEDKSKPAKRGSIFGKMPGGWMKSPTKEKDQKDAELRPEVPPKDNVVSENPPQLPVTATQPPMDQPTTTEGNVKPETTETTTPGKERPGFLSGLSFMNKRNRSVSPSANTNGETPAKTEEVTAAEVPKGAEPIEASKTDVPVADTIAAEPLKTEEPRAAEPTTDEPKADSTPNKRQSMLGSLGRRASKAFKGMQTPKKENTVPATETKKTDTPAAAPAEDKPVTNGESKPVETEQTQQIGDVVPDAITAGRPEHQPAAVSASA